MRCPYHCYSILAGTGAIAGADGRSPATEGAIAVENVGARHQQMIGKNEKCNYRRAPAAGAQTRSHARENAIGRIAPGHGKR